MKYTEVKVTITPCSDLAVDLLTGLLGEIGYDSFVNEDFGFSAYIPTVSYDEEALNALFAEFPLDAVLTYTSEEMPDKNWNEEWEKNYFQPVIIGTDCVVHSTFHKNVPEARYSILIDPKMAFGTGHHQTTSLIIREILKTDLTGKSVLDMGCGTAVLAILAAKRGASDVTAIDIDEWACENARENVRLNGENRIDVRLGGAELLGNETYDVIFANINRNILLNDMAVYVRCLHSGSDLYMSGFYVEDIPAIQAEAERNGLRFVSYSEDKNWVAVRFTKA